MEHYATETGLGTEATRRLLWVGSLRGLAPLNAQQPSR